MPDGSSPRADIALSLFLIVICSVVLFEARDIPPGTFEPLGSAPIPQATAGLIILCAIAVMVRALFQARRGVTDPPAAEIELRPGDAGLVLVLTALYVVALQVRLLDFAPMTVVFLVATIGLLTRFERRQLPWIALVALIIGYGCEYLFTRIFVVDLPGL